MKIALYQIAITPLTLRIVAVVITCVLFIDLFNVLFSNAVLLISLIQKSFLCAIVCFYIIIISDEFSH